MQEARRNKRWAQRWSDSLEGPGERGGRGASPKAGPAAMHGHFACVERGEALGGAGPVPARALVSMPGSSLNGMPAARCSARPREQAQADFWLYNPAVSQGHHNKALMTGSWKHLFFSVLDAGLYNPGVTGGFLQGRRGRVCPSFWCHGRPWLSAGRRGSVFTQPSSCAFSASDLITLFLKSRQSLTLGCALTRCNLLLISSYLHRSIPRVGSHSQALGVRT